MLHLRGIGLSGASCIARIGRLAFTRAEKLIAVSSAAKVAYKDTQKTCEVHEMELMCAAVDESQFGSALADTILVQDAWGVLQFGLEVIGYMCAELVIQ